MLSLSVSLSATDLRMRPVNQGLRGAYHHLNSKEKKHQESVNDDKTKLLFDCLAKCSYFEYSPLLSGKSDKNKQL